MSALPEQVKREAAAVECSERRAGRLWQQATEQVNEDSPRADAVTRTRLALVEFRRLVGASPAKLDFSSEQETLEAAGLSEVAQQVFS